MKPTPGLFGFFGIARPVERCSGLRPAVRWSEDARVLRSASIT
jgi:hypothetical protein